MFHCTLCQGAGIIPTRVVSLGQVYTVFSLCPGTMVDGMEWPCPVEAPGLSPEFQPDQWTPEHRAQVRARHQDYRDQGGAAGLWGIGKEDSHG